MQRKTRALTWITVLLITLLALSVPFVAEADEGVEVRVIRIIDGDTIRVDLPILGDTSVRFIGMDTPESRKNNRTKLQAREEGKDIEEIIALGKRATKHLKSKLKKDDMVRLEFDAERTDRYGRVLAYVWSGDTMLNALMVRDGYAYPLTIPPNVKYEELFRDLFREAREQGRGLWGD